MFNNHNTNNYSHYDYMIMILKSSRSRCSLTTRRACRKEGSPSPLAPRRSPLAARRLPASLAAHRPTQVSESATSSCRLAVGRSREHPWTGPWQSPLSLAQALETSDDPGTNSVSSVHHGPDQRTLARPEGWKAEPHRWVDLTLSLDPSEGCLNEDN